jgi:hypothetical protein
MDNEVRAALRSLELQNESKGQELSMAKQKIASLEQDKIDLLSEIESLTSDDPTYVSNETQIEFIRKVAESRTKFAKEAKDIVDVIDGIPDPVVEETPAEETVIEETPVDPNA